MEGKVGADHPALVQLVKQCLHNVPRERPSTEALLTSLQGMRVEVEGEYGGPIRLDMVRLRLAKEVKEKDRRIQDLTQQQVMDVCTETIKLAHSKSNGLLIMDRMTGSQQVLMSDHNLMQGEHQAELEANQAELEARERQSQQLQTQTQQLQERVGTKDNLILQQQNQLDDLTRQMEVSGAKLSDIQINASLCVGEGHSCAAAAVTNPNKR